MGFCPEHCLPEGNGPVHIEDAALCEYARLRCSVPMATVVIDQKLAVPLHPQRGEPRGKSRFCCQN